MTYKAVLLILDGLGDFQYKKLGGKTPLEAAKTKNLDLMSKSGETGFMFPIAPGIIPGSDTAHLSIFGYDPHKYYFGRGLYEALGAGLELQEQDVAFRANLATIENNLIVDRRAGRKSDFMPSLFEELNGITIEDVTVIAKHTSEHRGVVVLRGPGLSDKISDVDPHKTGVPINYCQPLEDSEEARKTARIVNQLMHTANEILERSKNNALRKSHGLLPANALLIRGAARYHTCESIFDKTSARFSCVAGGALYKGVAKFVGMNVLEVPGATGDKFTNLKAKLEAAIKAKENSDVVFLHIKATDSFGHDGDFLGKKRFIEKVDREVIPGLMRNFDVVVVTGDHSTPCVRKEHSGDQVPLLVWGKNCRADKGVFSETNPNATLFIRGQDLINIILNKIEILKKYGE
ncbi:MAG: 2,3-bisphosphoglycerate-independent phosphoglycerate mutase [Candidatus Woesearchaeota archaeon]|nr:2,3-bisphosphoglycerate-independent phosphoglycerate mutase [Candidatus Woesearchaeota archaeon]MDN5327500.1 2,3-bisphosphoglycerate-independent phosphoglycerate mutase [Candidatus Woesearchaeota archaeon]